MIVITFTVSITFAGVITFSGDTDPRQSMAEKVFDYNLDASTEIYLEENNLKYPSLYFLEGDDASAASQKSYQKWRKDFKSVLIALTLQEEAAVGEEKNALKDYHKQLQAVEKQLPIISEAGVDFNQGFGQKDFTYWKTQNWKSPHEVFMKGVDAKLKSPEAFKDWETETTKQLKELKHNNSNPAFKKYVKMRNKYHDIVEGILKTTGSVKQTGSGRKQKNTQSQQAAISS